MSGRRPSTDEKVGAWYMAFNAIREELTPPAQRTEAHRSPVAPDLVRLVAANDRMAALVAGLLVGSGAVRPIPADDMEGV